MASPSRRVGGLATALTLSVLAVVPLSLVAVLNPGSAVPLMAEGGVVEWVQVGLMAAGGALAARHGWSAARAGRPAALDVAIVATMVVIVVGELDLDRVFVGTKIISTYFFVNPKHPLAWRALAVLVVVGLPVAVGLWLLARWRYVVEASWAGLREPWGQTAASGMALFTLVQVFEGPIDHIPGPPHHFLEELLELVSAIWIFIGLVARRGR